MTLETNKMLGGIGAILMFIGIIPAINIYGIVEIVGAILVLIALYGLSKHYQDSGIFNNALYGIIIAIIGVIITVIFALTVVFANIVPILTQLYPGWDGNWASLSGMTPDPNAFTSSNVVLSDFMSLFIGIAGVAVVAWIVSIISTFFVRRSLKSVTAKSNVGLFGTAGLIMLIGAFLLIIAIGAILIWVGALILAIAFFQIKQTEPLYATPASEYPPPPPTSS
jgi:uncharacterized membrane protein